MMESAPDALLAAVTAEAGLTGTQIVRGTGKSMLVAGEMDCEPVIAKILRTADPFWVAKWQHEIDIYRSFAWERPPVRIPRLKWTNGQTALILEWIGDRPADEGRYLSRPLDAGDIGAIVAAAEAISAWQPAVPGSPAGQVMVDYEKRIDRYYRRGFFTPADREALLRLLARCGDRRDFGHGDLLPANILLGAGHTCTLVDWEFGGQYLPGYDLATLSVLLGDAAPAIRPRIAAAVAAAGRDAEFCVNLACILVRELRIHQEVSDTDRARDRLPGLAEAWAQGRRRLHALAG
jgi:Phosphotransferase enzyme family